MRMRCSMTALVAMLALGATAALADERRDCLYERQIYEGVSRVVALSAAVVTRGNRGAVAVGGGGTYQSQVRPGANGAVEVTFRTPVSTEVLAVAAGGGVLTAGGLAAGAEPMGV